MFRIAAHLGMTVGELSPRLSSAELTEWAAYFRMNPPDLLEQGMRMLLALTFNVNRGKDVEPASPEDFLKTWEPPVEIDPVAELRRLEAFFEGRVR